MSYSKLYNYEDFLSFLSDSGYSDAEKKKKAVYNASLLDQLVPLAAQKQSINESSDELARQAYISYLSASKELPEKLSAAGLNGGVADNMYLSLVNEYQKNYNQIGKDRNSKLNDVDTAMNQARSKKALEYSSAMSDLYDSAVKSFLDARENDEKRNFDSYYNDKELAESAADRKAQAEKNKSDTALKQLQYELEKAKLAFEAGDSSLYEKLGITPKDETNAENGSAVGSGSSGSTDFNDLLKQLDYAVSLAEFGNFDLLCKITGMTQEEAALKFAKVDESGYSEKQIKDAAKLFMGGDYSNNVLGVLKSAYPEYTYQQIWNIWKDVAVTEWMIFPEDNYHGPKG